MKEISMETKLKFKKIYFIIMFFIIRKFKQFRKQNNFFKINNEIITYIDVEDEKNYLIALNPNLKKLKYDEIIEVTKNQLLGKK